MCFTYHINIPKEPTSPNACYALHHTNEDFFLMPSAAEKSFFFLTTRLKLGGGISFDTSFAGFSARVEGPALHSSSSSSITSSSASCLLMNALLAASSSSLSCLSFSSSIAALETVTSPPSL